MTVKNLKKAFIEPLNGKQKGQIIEVLFNPGEYSVEKSNTFQSNSVPGLETPLLQFASGNADSLSMELFFDTYTYEQGEDIRKYTDKLVALLHIDSQLHAPPVCRFVWGKFQFKAIIERLTQKFTMFLDDGTPVRATLNVTFKEYRTITEQLQEIGRESADRTKRKVIKEGDSLWLLAAEEYGAAALWRTIARKNEIHNPRKLEAGREIVIPPLDK
ncbi:FIG00613121: hypothetical protein [Olavius sp. associated proteobacterium Delta 1]|nr:FIG00613121: hypothetical protein [Olavius sp. associated proteobacterium Delta 1]